MDRRSAFGPALRCVLAREDIKPAELARRTHMDPGNVSTMLSGRGREPTLATLRRIVQALPESVDLRALIIGEQVCNTTTTTKEK